MKLFYYISDNNGNTRYISEYDESQENVIKIAKKLKEFEPNIRFRVEKVEIIYDSGF